MKKKLLTYHYPLYPQMRQYMTENIFQPKVIIRTSIGAKFPLDGGIQHTRDYTQMMKDNLTEIFNAVIIPIDIASP